MSSSWIWVRQLLGTQDDEPVQLHVTAQFPPEAVDDLAVEEDNLWTAPRGVLAEIERCDVFRTLRRDRPARVVVWVEEY